jgi:hypothetical protein
MKEDTPRQLLDRILETPHLARVVPRLPPEVLHRVIQNCGLEDCGELVALASPGQLAAVFDLDLWRPARPGRDEQFDADRFGLWLDVMMESGATVAAQKLADVDVDLAIAGFAQHMRVCDPAAGALKDGVSYDVGGYLVVARRSDAWDAIIAVLTSLGVEHPGYFHRVMRGCRSLSNSKPEIDGLDDLLPVDEQVMFDLAFNREQRREQQGYVSSAQARAFLQMSREVRLGHETTPPGNPIARAYFRAIESTTAADTDGGSRGLPAAPGSTSAPVDSTDGVNAIVEVLLDAGLLPQQHRALLEGSQSHASRLARIQAQMQFAGDHDEAAYWARSQELAFLANTMMAGCSIQSRPFTAREASDAAIAVCNLGLENWPRPLPDDFLVGHDLVSVFQVGWTVLHTDVCMYTAEQLIAVAARLRHDDREIHDGLDALRIEMTRHYQTGAPWRARDFLEVIMFLDMPAWATLVGLIDECPVIHAGLGASGGSPARAVSASAFEFIAENNQIASVREFIRSLPDTLRP